MCNDFYAALSASIKIKTTHDTNDGEQITKNNNKNNEDNGYSNKSREHHKNLRWLREK